VIEMLANISELGVTDRPVGNAASFIVQSTEFYIPIDGEMDVEKEREGLEKDLAYQLGFLEAVNRKLSNEKFVSSAPGKVIEAERRKKADAEARIRVIRDSLARFSR
jgi:valyl-tRNA synthetase